MTIATGMIQIIPILSMIVIMPREQLKSATVVTAGKSGGKLEFAMNTTFAFGDRVE